MIKKGWNETLAITYRDYIVIHSYNFDFICAYISFLIFYINNNSLAHNVINKLIKFIYNIKVNF